MSTIPILIWISYVAIYPEPFCRE